MENALQSLHKHRQSVWLDYVRRNLITSGELKQLVEEDGVRGLTSNPSIFEQAINDSNDYRDLLEAPESQAIDAKTLYEHIAVRDIQDAADVLQPLYLESKRRDGYVSLEVSPRLAHETQGSLGEARRLWQTVARENLMIKIPATLEGIPVVQQLISEGINVNVTLLFSQRVHQQVVEAYFGGLESLARQGGDLSKVASVASFFISRIDTAVDRWIAERLKQTLNPGEQARLRSLLGKVAIASAKDTYQKYLDALRGERWQQLNRRGAQSQRLLWASTRTKNPNYRDVLYVEELIGPDTVNTMAPATLAAFRDHGHVQSTLNENLEEAISILDLVRQVAIPFQAITDQLLQDGVKQFTDAFAKLLKATDRSQAGSYHDPTDFLRIKVMKELYQGQHHS